MTRSSEHERIKKLRSLFASSQTDGLLLSIGDDAAVLAPGEHPLVWSIDAAVEGTHFRRDLMSLEDAGYRATMAALSDLAAMGASPMGVLSSLVLPRTLTDDELEAIARGQRDAAALCGTVVIGGNLARGDAISITTAVLGRAERPLTRSGARATDRLWLSGDLGWAALGLALLEEKREADSEHAVRAFRRPRARIAEGLAAVRAGATAAIDVSDGAAADAFHVASESALTIVLDEAALADDELGELAASIGRPVLDLILAGGEDYALLCAAPASATLEGFRPIGELVAGSPQVLLRERTGTTRPISAPGFDHFGL
ncbi:MAG: thiamine-phosphate kinase [Polyangiaceae bacterium]|nr:thiamine-phosphate kinase [Polyangiaceae bacterium]